MESEALQPVDSTELDFSNPRVQTAVRNMIKSKAVAASPEAFNRLLGIADKGDEKVALSAIKLILQAGGMILNKSQVEMRVSFDDLRKRSTSEPDALTDLFEIKGEIIEAEQQPIGEEDDYEAWEAGQCTP